MRLPPLLFCFPVPLILIVLSGSVSLFAQEASSGSPPHGGFWIGVGVGAGSRRIDCGACGAREPDDPWEGGSGISGYVAAGGTVRRNLQLGGEANVWAKRSAERRRDATLFLLSWVARYDPVPASGVYVKGGVGVGGSVLAGGPGLIESGGWGVQAGGGYDLRLGDRMSLSPFLGYVQLFSRGAAGESEGVAARGPDNPSYVQLGLGLLWH